jgi:hypothetical protein
MLKQLGFSMHDEILSEIENFENDRNLYQEENVNARLEVIDYLEFHVIDRLHMLMESMDTPDQLNILKEYTQKVMGHLEEINNKVYLFIRKKIQEGYRGKVLMGMMDEFFDGHLCASLNLNITGYDNLDIFLNGILTDQILPGETKEREGEMVYYQKTPARIILALIEKAAFKPQDIFFDLGSGLGQVTILVNLLSSVISKGVEFEPAFYSYAKTSADTLYLNDVEFIHSDARYADYSSGTVFFMYSPFEGKMLLEVLQNLHGESKKRKIRIFTYGPRMREVANQNWLIKEYGVGHSSDEFCEFNSV